MLVIQILYVPKVPQNERIRGFDNVFLWCFAGCEGQEADRISEKCIFGTFNPFTCMCCYIWHLPGLTDFFAQIRVCAGDLIWKEDPGGHSGKDEDPEREELEVPDEDASHLGVGQVLARQEPLGDYLFKSYDVTFPRRGGQWALCRKCK